MNSSAPLVEARELAAGYNGRAAIEGLTFTITRGERVALLGPNGGGKTTLLRVLLGELDPLRGSLRVAARRAVVPQTERSRLDYPVSALDVALMGTLARLPWWRRPAKAERQAARDALQARRPRWPRACHVRRALGRAAPARLDRPRTCSGGRASPARRALHRTRRDERSGTRGADREFGRLRAQRGRCRTRPPAGPPDGQGPLRQPPPDRLRGPEHGPRSANSRGDLWRHHR